ncbi:MAG: hypothetical protein U0Y68_14205 [Blastocatellia bacterium]
MKNAFLSAVLCLTALVCLPASSISQAKQYFPPAGTWAKKAPAELGMDAAALDAAIKFARSL